MSRKFLHDLACKIRPEKIRRSLWCCDTSMPVAMLPLIPACSLHSTALTSGCASSTEALYFRAVTLILSSVWWKHHPDNCTVLSVPHSIPFSAQMSPHQEAFSILLITSPHPSSPALQIQGENGLFSEWCWCNWLPNGREKKGVLFSHNHKIHS